MDPLGLHPLGVNELLNGFLLEEFVVDFILGLLGNDISVIQVIKFLLRIILVVSADLLTNDHHVEVDVEVLDFELFLQAFRLALVLFNNVIGDLIFYIKEILEANDGKMFLFIVREGW